MSNPSRSTRFALIRFWGKFLLRLVIMSLVVWGLWRTVDDAQRELRNTGFRIGDLRVGWLVFAGAIYAVGMLPASVFWKRTLEAMGQHPSWIAAIRAFYIGSLGKYVPGKALVVVIRTSLVHGPKVDATVAAIAVFVETLTFMAVGAVVAAAMLMSRFFELLESQRLLLLLAILLAFSTGLPTWPPIFRRIIRALQVRRASSQVDGAVAGVNLRLMAFGWVTISIGWCCLGASLWATLNAIPLLGPVPFSSDWPLLTAAVALAMVAGFLSLIPAGAFVREFVVVTLLETTYGPTVALLSAVVLRVVWLITEVAIAGPLYLTRPRNKEPGD